MKHFILAIILTVFADTEQYSCNDNDPTRCACTYMDNEYTIHCPPIMPKILIHASDNFVNVDCFDTDQSDVDNLPDFTDNTTIIKIRFCQLPEESFLTLFNKFGIRNLEHIMLENVVVLKDSAIRKEFFVGLSNIDRLTLSKIPEKLDNDLLQYLPNLTQFYLENSNQEDLNNFNFPKTLKVLHLTGNLLTEVPKGTVQNLTDLKQLHLWHNTIKQIKRNDFIGLKSLKSLELSMNIIDIIEEDSFVDLKELKTINLRANRLNKINSTVFKHNIHLKSIRLEDNPDITLPERIFSDLKELNYVNIKNSKIDYLPENIFENSDNITNIYMQKNRIKNVPEKLFKGLSKLKTLDLSSNLINEFSNTVFSDLYSLEILNLDNNNLTNIDSYLLNKVANLKTLSIKNNRINNIEPDAFIRLKKLEFLDLSNNFYKIWDSRHPFALCVSLVNINLRNNRIEEVPDIFLSLVNLQEIDLSYNAIKYFEMTTVFPAGSPRLRSIDLSNNQIKEVDFRNVEMLTLINLKNLDAYNNRQNQIDVNLKNNPLICDCGVYDLVRYCQDDMIPGVKASLNLQIDGVKCSGPKMYKHLNVLDLKPNQILCKLPLENCPKKCESYWRPYGNIWEIQCSKKNMTQFPTLNIPNKNISLFLNGNYIRSGLEPGLGYENVKNLYLSDNSLQELKWIPEGIETLTLDGNYLTHLDKDILSLMTKTESLKKIQLLNNPWICDCSAFELQNFIRDHYKIINTVDVLCQEDLEPLIEKRELCKSSTVVTITCIILILFVLLMAIVVIAVCVSWKHEIKMWVFSKTIQPITKDELDDKLYDIFISYSCRDEEFVFKKLLPVLEVGPKTFKVCIYSRDAIADNQMLSNYVTNSILKSRRVLIILSGNFLNDIWKLEETKNAHIQAIKQGKTKVIMVKYGEFDYDKLDEDLKRYLNTNSYVEWGKPWFWNKLMYALPRNPNANLKFTKDILIQDKVELV